ncbi:MAG TPA: OsmC family protein [Rhodocyclaceae bacterium]|nr:OsmC family protein [Rhodocyclaceae bacterium]
MSARVIVAENGLGRYQQTVTIGQHQLLADEPESVGGSDAGPAPFEFLMAGLGACTAMTIRMYAERKEMPLTGIKVALSHDKTEVDGKLVERIERNITLEGSLSPEQRERLLDIANRCPVHRALMQPLVVETHLLETTAAD